MPLFTNGPQVRSKLQTKALAGSSTRRPILSWLFPHARVPTTGKACCAVRFGDGRRAHRGFEPAQLTVIAGIPPAPIPSLRPEGYYSWVGYHQLVSYAGLNDQCVALAVSWNAANVGLKHGTLLLAQTLSSLAWLHN